MLRIATVLLLSFVNILGLLAERADSVTRDSVDAHLSVREVTVTGSNMQRQHDGSLWIFPNASQRKHAANGFGVLRNLMLPGLQVDEKGGKVSMMSVEATLYVNGQPCDINEVSMMRPQDILRIEYMDMPDGKYANDKFAINFVLRTYRYGGYVSASAEQIVGFSSGYYSAAATLSSGNMTYSLFAGASYKNVGSGETVGSELYKLPAGNVFRERNAAQSLRKNDEYVQFRAQNKRDKSYWVGKLTLYNKSTPSDAEEGWLRDGSSLSEFGAVTSRQGLSPKIDFSGQVSLAEFHTLNYAINGSYSRNSYDRNYTEATFASATHAEEDAYRFMADVTYSYAKGKNAFTGMAIHYHDVWISSYTGDNPLWQHLWKGESLALVSYTRKFGRNLSLRLRTGLDWMQFRLHGSSKFSQLTPRLNVAMQLRLHDGLLSWQAFYANPTYGMNVLNNAQVEMSPYMTMRGTGSLRRASNVNSNIYYSQNFGKLSVMANPQYFYGHNLVLNSYGLVEDGSRVLKTFANDIEMHEVSFWGSVSYRLMDKLQVKCNGAVSYTSLRGSTSMSHTHYVGYAGVLYYLGDFMLAANVTSRRKFIDFRNTAIVTEPIDYDFSCSYSHKGFFAQLYLGCPFAKRRTHRVTDTDVYWAGTSTFDRSQSRFVSISLRYTFDFGRKTDRINEEIDRNINSAILTSGTD